MPVFEEAAGLYRIPVFTPFDTPETNVYVFRGDRTGLVDTGIRHPKTRDDLLCGLRTLGIERADVDLIVVTHAHVDHHGLAGDFAGSDVLVGRRDLDRVREFSKSVRADLEDVHGLLEPWGVPASLAGSLDDLFGVFLGMAGSVPDAVGVDGTAVLGGLGPDLQVIELPGHTEGLIGLFRAADGLLISSDHLLSDITPNPGLYISEGGKARSGLPDYVRSLATVRDLPVRRALPGHGPSFGDVPSRIDAILAHHEIRLEDVRAAAGRGRTIFEISARMFPGLGADHSYLALREVYGHVEILLEQGRLVRRREGPVEIVEAA